MFENAFNLKFNLHKAYVDIGIKDNDAIRLAGVYDLTAAETQKILDDFRTENKKNAASILKEYPNLQIDTNSRIKIAYIGDSITSDRISHQHIMECILSPYPNIEMRDFSISGWKVSDVLTAYYPGIANFAPDIAVVMIGTNDMRRTDDEFQYNHTSPAEYERDLNYVVKKLTDSFCQVILCTLPPFCMKKMTQALPDWKILYTNEDWAGYNDVIINIAGKYGISLVDMRGIYNSHDPADITIDDGLHLNAAGQTMLAGEVFKKLAPMLKGARHI